MEKHELHLPFLFAPPKSILSTFPQLPKYYLLLLQAKTSQRYLFLVLFAVLYHPWWKESVLAPLFRGWLFHLSFFSCEKHLLHSLRPVSLSFRFDSDSAVHFCMGGHERNMSFIFQSRPSSPPTVQSYVSFSLSSHTTFPLLYADHIGSIDIPSTVSTDTTHLLLK